MAAFDAYKPKALKRRSTRRAPPKIAREGGSKGVATLLDSWGTGDVPGNVVFRVVTNFADDLENMTEDIVASMKTLSLSPDAMDSRNCSRNLIRRFTLGGKLPEPIQVECPMKVPRKGGTTMGKVWVIAPHELFAMLHDNYKADFDKRIGTLKKNKEYWECANIVGDPQFKDHPVLTIPRYNERCIPIAIHGDGGPYTQKIQNPKSIDVMSWSSELGEGWSLDVPINYNSIFAHIFSH